MARIDISGMDKAEVLMRLFNGGFNDVNHGPIVIIMQRMLPPLTVEEARQAIEQHTDARGRIYFDYFKGKALKVNLSKDILETALYDRDCGPHAASKALGLPELPEGK